MHTNAFYKLPRLSDSHSRCNSILLDMLSIKYLKKCFSFSVLMAQMLFGFGILAATMPSYIAFIMLWFCTGMYRVTLMFFP